MAVLLLGTIRIFEEYPQPSAGTTARNTEIRNCRPETAPGCTPDDNQNSKNRASETRRDRAKPRKSGKYLCQPEVRRRDGTSLAGSGGLELANVLLKNSLKPSPLTYPATALVHL
jgi:hypothetical protein